MRNLAEAYRDDARNRIEFYEGELMSRGPNKYMTPDSVRDRVRRAGKGHAAHAHMQIDNTLAAIIALEVTGHVTSDHVEAHRRWLQEYGAAKVENLV
jgi:hypothetical protein